MRLLTRTIWRAFPELDAFDDEMCRAFVKAASRSITWGTVRYASVILVSLAGGVGAVIQVDKAVYARSMSSAVVTGLGAAMVLSMSFIMALIVRDVLLRRRVLSVIRKVGTCGSCGYLLLGQRVPEDLRVVCPECGTVTEVIPAIGELHTDEGGEATYVARLPRPDERSNRRRRIAWRVIKFVGKVVLWFLLIAGIVIGISFGLLYWQSREAIRGRTSVADWERRWVLAACHSCICTSTQLERTSW